jgi:mannose-6-phosphate isomerase-like protein (cupin superfamily)
VSELDNLLERQVARFVDRVPDWDAFADARVDGYRRAQHRFIGAGGSGKHGGTDFIPAGAFTLSIMFVPPGQGNAAHTHEVEEIFFILQGKVKVFFEDGAGRVETVLGPWDCVSCPANVIHGYENVGLEPAYLQVMLGAAKPQLMGYVDETLARRRDEHLKTPSR